MKKMFKPKVMLKSNVEAYILDVRNSKSSPSATEKKNTPDYFWKSLSNATQLEYQKLKYAGLVPVGFNSILTTHSLPWLKKEGFTWPEDKPLTCHSFRCGVESYLMNVCKVDRFYIARQGSWAITELAGDLLLRYDREQTISELFAKHLILL
jgi:hypothetical protein